MDETLIVIYTAIQKEIELVHNVTIPIDKIHKVVQHQGLIMKESIEVMNSIRIPYIGVFKPVARSLERNYERGKILTVKNNLYNMLKT